MIQHKEQINLCNLIDHFSNSGIVFAKVEKTDTVQKRECNIWREADHFVRRKLHILNWHIDEVITANDHICYLGFEDSIPFTLYLFACREQEEQLLHHDYLLRLASDPENTGRDIYFLYTRVVEEESPLLSLLKAEPKIKSRKVFRARSIDDSSKEPDLWKVEHVDNHDLLIKEPDPWMLERTDRHYTLVPSNMRAESNLKDRLIAAFNSGDYDLVKALLSRKCRDTLPLESFNHIYNVQDFFKALYELYGKLKPAYIRFDRYTFLKVACWESGIYLMPITSNGFQFDQLIFQPLDGQYRELIILDKTPTEHPSNIYPRLVSFRCIPRYWNRFLMELSFENGEIKEYNLPDHGIGDEVAIVDGFCFTDRLFFYGRITESAPYPAERVYLDHFDHGQRIVFPNGYSISTPELYFGSDPAQHNKSRFV